VFIAIAGQCWNHDKSAQVGREKRGLALLETRNLSKTFGGLTAVQHVNLTVEPGVIHAIIGPNGAGKSTLFNLLSGHLEPTAGQVCFDGQDITRRKPHRISHLGLSRSFQLTSVFPELTVHENVRVAVQSRSRHSYRFWHPVWYLREPLERTARVLEHIGLADKAMRKASELSHGDQRVLEVAIALATDPKLLLLDEPTSGMSREEAKAMIQLITHIAAEVTVVLIEHNMPLVMAIADRITVLHHGEVIAEGTPAEVQAHAEVRRAYLGG
jgi:branched-chain amino acid transport system ATP-binding protein